MDSPIGVGWKASRQLDHSHTKQSSTCKQLLYIHWNRWFIGGGDRWVCTNYKQKQPTDHPMGQGGVNDSLKEPKKHPWKQVGVGGGVWVVTDRGRYVNWWSWKDVNSVGDKLLSFLANQASTSLNSILSLHPFCSFYAKPTPWCYDANPFDSQNLSFHLFSHVLFHWYEALMKSCYGLVNV